MKKTCIRYLLLTILCFFCWNQLTEAQQLVQSFIEVNSSGNTYFGYSVAGAGDVNKDTYADVIVGVYNYNSSQGRAYIYYGGSSMDNTADVTLTGEATSIRFGYSVAGAGDVNKDTYADVIVGAYNYNSSQGSAYIYYGGSGMDNVADVTLMGEATSDYFGCSVSGAGDVNKDTYADVIVGAYGYNSYQGRAYIYYGGSGMDNAADVILNGEATSIRFGWSVAGAGDVNKDTYADVIVGAYNYNSSQGSANIYYGGSGMDNTADVTLMGEATSNYFGYSVSGAGDVNKDTYADVIVGAYRYNSYQGCAYIYYGGSSMNNTADVTLTGEATGNRFGWSVAGAGDVNNDTYADIIVGAYCNSTNTGRAYIFYGSGSLSGNILAASANVTLIGEGTNNYFGSSVAGAGDVNNDTYADVIVGAYYYSSTTGRAYIYYGGSSMDNIADVTLTGEGTNNQFGYSVAGAGDVNKDTYADVIVGAYLYSSNTGRAYIYYGGNPMDNVADVTMTGETTNNCFGVSVAGAGDVNKDTYADVIVGANGNSTNTGRAYVFYGSGSLSGNILAASANVTLTGEGTNNYFGSSVAGAGDVNNDSYADIIVGAYGNSTSRGRAYIYYGGSSMNNTADVTLTGELVYAYFGSSVAGAGDVNKDTYADVIVGAYGNSTGSAYIYYGGSSMNNTADVTLTGEWTYDYFGYSVAGAGDVNKDTYADVIVGAYNYNNSQGRAYIYYGGSGMDNVADVTLTGEGTGNRFGYSVAGAGDVNKDTYADIIVGAYGYNSYQGRAYIFYGGSSMDSGADITLTGEATGNYFGCSVAGAGDLNKEGYADFLVGAYLVPINGKAYFYSHSSAPLPVELTSFTATANESNVTLNWQTATEVNNYGFNVERASTSLGMTWEKIGFVQGHGNSNSPKSYSFTDANPPSGTVQYRLKQIDFDGKYEYSDVVEVNVEAPASFSLNQNYPNPCNPTTVISYKVQAASHVTIKVYDLLGREVVALVNEIKSPGNYEVRFDGSKLASGVYTYTMNAGNYTSTKKMILMK